MLEKGRAQMQNQFDSWYNNLQSRGGSLSSANAVAAVMAGGGPVVAPVKVTTATFAGDLNSQVILFLSAIYVYILYNFNSGQKKQQRSENTGFCPN